MIKVILLFKKNKKKWKMRKNNELRESEYRRKVTTISFFWFYFSLVEIIFVSI